MSAGGEESDAALPVWAKTQPRRRGSRAGPSHADGPAREARRRPALSRDAIVDAAVAIADTEGLEAASIRRVAGELGARPMSLYTYIDTKEDLLTLMSDRVKGEVLFGADMPGGWRNALAAIAGRTRAVILRHPWLTCHSAHNADVGPNGLRHVEECLAAITDLGLSPLDAAEVLFAVDRYVMGHVSFEVPDRIAGPERAAARPYLESLLATGEFPRLAQLAAAGMALMTEHSRAEPQYEQQFERGLNWLLDGIAADVKQQAGT
jgi:AcrR family transcriptional regulator